MQVMRVSTNVNCSPEHLQLDCAWDELVKGGGKVELNSEGMGGWGFVSYRSFVLNTMFA